MATAYLQKQITATNTTAITFSAWVKRSKLGYDAAAVFQTENNSSDYLAMVFNGSDKIDFQITGTQNRRITTRVFRDINAWYHILVAIDSSQGSADDRIKLYINGSQETSFDTKTTNMSQGSNLSPIDATLNYAVGYYPGQNTNYFDGQMAHVHYVVGTAYAPSTFGETDSTTGIWKPKVSPTGVNYGSKGFFLKFDNSANMGLDSSGLTNNLTVSGTIIQNKDTPSNVFNVLNQSNPTASNFTISDCATKITKTGSGTLGGYLGTIMPTKGKYYFEAKIIEAGNGDRTRVGVANYDSVTDSSTLQGSYSGLEVSCKDAKMIVTINGTETETTASGAYSDGDIVQIAMDLDNKAIYVGRNGTFVTLTGTSGGDPTSGASKTGAIVTDTTYILNGDPMCVYFGHAAGVSDTSTVAYNFGNGFFGTTAVSSAQNPDDGIGICEHDVPAGYRALCTKSLNAQEYS